MKAIAITVGKGGARLVDRPEPSIQAADEIKLRILRVGICGTDREEVEGGRALAAAGSNELVIGHEMLGQVVETGAAVRRLKAGDYAVFTVRRGCSKCLPCTMLRPDMCRTGQYRERGIWGLDGYQAEYVVDSERWAVRVPAELADVAVLAEPMSVVEKAIDEAVAIQRGRLPDTLASPQWLAQIGGHYIDGRQVDARHVEEKVGAMDFVLEATGVPRLSFNLLDALAPDGALALTGIPGGERPTDIPGAELVREAVLRNLLLFGSVNAARDHFQMGIEDLALARLRWPGQVARLITHRHKFSEAPGALAQHTPDEIKAVIEW